MQKASQVAAAKSGLTAVCKGDKLIIHRALVTKLAVFFCLIVLAFDLPYYLMQDAWFFWR